MPPVLLCIGSGSRMYQLDTSSIPSGFACTSSVITSSRKRCVSVSWRLTIW